MSNNNNETPQELFENYLINFYTQNDGERFFAAYDDFQQIFNDLLINHFNYNIEKGAKVENLGNDLDLLITNTINGLQYVLHPTKKDNIIEIRTIRDINDIENYIIGNFDNLIEDCKDYQIFLFVCYWSKKMNTDKINKGQYPALSWLIRVLDNLMKHFFGNDYTKLLDKFTNNC